MYRRLISILAYRLLITCVVATTTLLAASLSWGQQSNYFQIATGSSSGTYFPIGTIIANGVSNPRGAEFCADPNKCGVPGLLAVALTTQGSVENIDRIVKGEVESGLSQADIAHAAFTGTGRYLEPGPVDNLRVIARLYTEALHVVTRQGLDMNTLADLKGQRVSIGLPESGTAVDARLLLQRAGIELAELDVQFLSSGAAADAIEQGQLDAFFAVTGVPSRAVMSLSSNHPIKLLPIDQELRDKWVRDFPFYITTDIPAGVYPGVGNSPTIGVNALWLVSAKIDDDLVYKMTRALWNDATRHLLDTGHPKGRQILLENAIDGVTLPLHPGARQYYKERGLVD